MDTYGMFGHGHDMANFDLIMLWKNLNEETLGCTVPTGAWDMGCLSPTTLLQLIFHPLETTPPWWPADLEGSLSSQPAQVQGSPGKNLMDQCFKNLQNLLLQWHHAIPYCIKPDRTALRHHAMKTVHLCLTVDSMHWNSSITTPSANLPWARPGSASHHLQKPRWTRCRSLYRHIPMRGCYGSKWSPRPPLYGQQKYVPYVNVLVEKENSIYKMMITALSPWKQPYITDPRSNIPQGPRHSCPSPWRCLSAPGAKLWYVLLMGAKCGGLGASDQETVPISKMLYPKFFVVVKFVQILG